MTPHCSIPPDPHLEVLLVTAGNPQRLTGGHLYNGLILETLRTEGFSARVVVLPGQPCRLAPLCLLARLRRRPPRLAIVDSIAVAATVPLLPWMRRRGIRVLALMHMLPSELAPGWRRPMDRVLEARLLRVADAVVAVSPSLGEQLVAAGAAPDRVVVIPPGRDGPSLGHSDPDALERRLQPHRPNHVTAESRDQADHLPAFRYLCVANWSQSKGIHLAVEAMARLDPRIQLDLVGEEGQGRYAREVRRLIHRHDLVERVHTSGQLPAAILAGHYASADAFVLPSSSEGFGTVYAEAMSFGLPVIACSVGPLPWLVEEGCGLLVRPEHVPALAQAMGMLAVDRGLCRRMGEAARRRSLRLPTWPESVAAFRTLALDLLARSNDEPSPLGHQ